MTDFRELSDRELDWEIAKRKGWTVTEESTSEERSDDTIHRLRNPEGKIQETRDRDVEPHRFTHIPGYTSNIRTAFNLLAELEDAKNEQFYVNMTYQMVRWDKHMRVNAIHWLDNFEGQNKSMTYTEFIREFYPEDLGLPPRNKE